MSLEGTVSIRERLLSERKALLDLSTRNRLVNIPLRARDTRSIEIVDEKAAEIFRLLGEGKSLTFLPGIAATAGETADDGSGDPDLGGIPQPDEEEGEEGSVAARHLDLRLQTRLTSDGLQKRLMNIWYDARTFEEEQGVNILYLAFGLLRWYESKSDQPRLAPLVLLPVSLERASATERFA